MRLAALSCLALAQAIAIPALAQTPPQAAPVTRPAPAPLKLESENVKLKLGLLLQPQYEMAGSTTLNGVSHNLFVRRIRLLAGATLFDKFEIFFDTDYPDLFTAAPDTGFNVYRGSTKVTSDVC